MGSFKLLMNSLRVFASMFLILIGDNNSFAFVYVFDATQWWNEIFAVYTIIMMLLQHDVLTDTSLPFAAPGLQHGGIWMYLLQRKHWSYDSFVMWNELKAGSTDPTITTTSSLETF